MKLNMPSALPLDTPVRLHGIDWPTAQLTPDASVELPDLELYDLV